MIQGRPDCPQTYLGAAADENLPIWQQHRGRIRPPPRHRLEGLALWAVLPVKQAPVLGQWAIIARKVVGPRPILHARQVAQVHPHYLIGSRGKAGLAMAGCGKQDKGRK